MDTRQYNLAPRLTAESPAKIRGARTDMSGKSQLRPIHACFCDALALRKACINENMRFFAAPCIAGAQGLLLRAKERQEKQRLGKTVHVTYTVDAAQGFAADCPVWPKSRGKAFPRSTKQEIRQRPVRTGSGGQSTVNPSFVEMMGRNPILLPPVSGYYNSRG